MKYVMGLMSGTSFDGVDGVVFDVNNKSICTHHFEPYTQKLKQACMALAVSQQINFDEINAVTFQVTSHYQHVIKTLLDNTSYNISVIGVHGQTIKHVPHGLMPYTVQLINASQIAVISNLPVAFDFRQKDMALGGQGAPLAPVFHQYLFNLNQHNVVLNLGGIANISYLDPEGMLRGFDTGPANALMDAWIFKHQGLPFDDKGQWASMGKVQSQLLAALMSHPYFSKPNPKSLDKETFSLAWLQQLLKETHFEIVDVQATLLSFTCHSIIHAIQHAKPHCREIIVCGGGAKNDYLLQLLSKQGFKVIPSNDLGYDDNKIEAMMMGWFAHKRLHQEPIDLTSVTGAKQPTIYGSLCLP